MENAVETLKKVDPYRWVMKKVEGEEEEILQTKIVGVQEMLKELPLWDAAIRSEIDSLFVQKEALKRITKQELDEIRGRHPEVAVLPGRLVCAERSALWCAGTTRRRARRRSYMPVEATLSLVVWP